MPAQLELLLEARADPAILLSRLHAAGLARTVRVVPHANRRVLVSVGRRGLRVHLGYALAPDEVLSAIALWARPRLPRATRRAAQRVLAGFPVHDHVPVRAPRRRVAEPVRPGDERILRRLTLLHAELNARHFGGVLGAVGFVLSTRMRRRLGEFRPAGPARALPEIGISRRHLRRDGWTGVSETLAHEMVHQWQAETGRPLAHDASFRSICMRIGIDGRAVRRLDADAA